MTTHRTCGQRHAPLTPCPKPEPFSQAVLAETADVLAKATRNLGQKVDVGVDVILGATARRAALELTYLADSLRAFEENR